MSETPKHEYELVYIIQPELNEEEISALDGRLVDVVTGQNGEVTGTELWGQRPLAYAIKRNTAGYYILHRLSMPPQATGEVERLLRLNENVLRYLIIRTDT
jgi:small subunit ribosomal protein S6